MDLEALIDIRWEEPPPIQPSSKKRTLNWEKYLLPFKEAPGVRGRILRRPTRRQCNNIVNRIKRRMEQIDPLGKWRYEVHDMQDRDGGCGLWITYYGQMTLQEQREREVLRRQRSADAKKRWAKRQLRLAAQDQQHQTVRPFRAQQKP
jgi:hypothetical protein